MNILFYAIPGQRTRDIESQAIEFRKLGHRVFLLSQSPRSPLHEYLENQGFETAVSGVTEGSKALALFKQSIVLWRCCRKNKIDIVYSHLDPCSLVAVFVQYFIRARVIVCRHHADALEYEANSRGRWSSRMIYRMAKTIIVVSNNARNYMVDVEKIPAGKIHVIPLCYNFGVYDLPDVPTTEAVRHQFPAALLLVTVGRLVVLKRINEMIDLVKKLVDDGRDVKLLVLGRGSEEARLRLQVNMLGLAERVIFLGFIPDVLPYLSAADVYLHLSVSEASCTVVKEAALVETPALVCAEVGDFAEYIVHEQNGWLVPKSAPVYEAHEIFMNIQPDSTREAGKRINETVHRQFDIRNVIGVYEELHRRQIG